MKWRPLLALAVLLAIIGYFAPQSTQSAFTPGGVPNFPVSTACGAGTPCIGNQYGANLPTPAVGVGLTVWDAPKVCVSESDNGQPLGCRVIGPATASAGTDVVTWVGSPMGNYVADSGVPVTNLSQLTKVMLQAAYTNATTTFSTVGDGLGDNFVFPVSANQNYAMVCHFYYQAASTGGLNIQITGPQSPTALAYALNAPLSATTFSNAVATVFSTSIGAAVSTATINFDAVLSMGLANGVNSGFITVQAKSSAAVNLTIQPGSFCEENPRS